MSNLSTLDRIQLEIKESIEREKELKQPKITNGVKKDLSKTSETRTNNRKFTPHSQPSNPTKGMMHKFIKSRGKLSMSSINKTNNINNQWSSNNMDFNPAKILIEKGSKPIRNGFVSAEEKMRKELQEFRQRENQLRDERRKSQPDLMAALQLEEENELVVNDYNNEHFNVLKGAKSISNLYSDDGFEDNCSSAGGSLKPARSLADLCDISDDENSMPGTHSLIMQFENLQLKNRPSSQSSSKGSF